MDNSPGFLSYHNSGPSGGKDFMKLAQSIGTSIQKISQNVSSMNKMVDQIGTHQDSPDLRAQLHQIQHYTNQLAMDTKTKLEQLSNIQAPPGTSDARQWKMQKDRLMEELMAALSSFQTTQRRAVDKEKEEVQRTRANMRAPDPFRPPPGKYSEPLIELDNVSSRSTPSQKQTQKMLAQEQLNLQELEDKERDLLQLEEDIQGLNQIFIDLGKLVHDQGVVIDSIEANVESATHQVSEGTRQLNKASGYQNKIRKKKCILFTILAIVLIIIIIIIVWQSN